MQMELVTPALKFSFYQPNQPIEAAYFPLSGVTSLLMLGAHGEEIEVSTVGNEGMVGLPLFLGADATPGLGFMQVPGQALRLPAERFRQLVTPRTHLYTLLQRYTQTLMIQMAQGVACNRLHTIEQRAARWLLMTHDRVNADSFALTQEFLGQMLGVRRASVSEVESELQQQGLLQYTRGTMTILDRPGLEKRTCECYWIVRHEFERQLGGD